MPNPSIATLIYTLRVKNQMTLEDLASEAGLSYSTILNSETGKSKPSVETLNKIAQALGVKASWMIKTIEEMKK